MALDGPPTTDGEPGLVIGPVADKGEIVDVSPPEARGGESEAETGTPAGTIGDVDWFGGVGTLKLSAWAVPIELMTLGTLITMPKPIKIKIRVLKGNFRIDVKSENSIVLFTFIRFDEKAVEFLLLYSIRIVVGSTYTYECTHQYGISDRRISPPLKDLSRYAKKIKLIARIVPNYQIYHHR